MAKVIFSQTYAESEEDITGDFWPPEAGPKWLTELAYKLGQLEPGPYTVTLIKSERQQQVRVQIMRGLSDEQAP